MRARPESLRRAVVVGTGAWGTVLSILFSRSVPEVTLYARFRAEADSLRAARENRRFLPGIQLPIGVAITADRAEGLASAELVVLAVPAQRLRENLIQLREFLPAGAVLLGTSKGIELGTGLRMSEVIADVLGERHRAALTLSGPNLSGEIARGLPAATVVAGGRAEGAQVAEVQRLLASDRMRVYTSVDQRGVELGGAMKNVIAIACGVCDGLGYGHNARAGLITRGLVEITRLTVAAGGRARTIAGLAGMGDLVATVASAGSRNYSLGVALGRGRSLAEITASSVHVAEGVETTAAALRLAARLGIELPVATQLQAVLSDQCSPEEGARALMRRALSAE